MAWRTEVKTLRGQWIVFDEERGTVGRRMLSRRRYEQLLVKAHPILLRREYRITQFDAPKSRSYPMAISLSFPAERRGATGEVE
jgi:hypothetical protein